MNEQLLKQQLAAAAQQTQLVEVKKTLVIEC
jgi:hypothetical protein